MESRTFKGIWWLPDNPEKRISGTLDFSREDGCTLELLDRFTAAPVGPIAADDHACPVIHGQTVASGDSATVTLLDNDRTQINSLLFGAAAVSTYRCGTALLGDHTGSQDELEIHEIDLTFDYAAAWCPIRNFSFEFPEHEIRVTNHFPEKAVFDLGEITAELYATHSMNPEMHRVELKSQPRFALKFRKPVTFDEAWTSVRHLQRFVALGLNRWAPIASASVTVETDGEHREVLRRYVNWGPGTEEAPEFDTTLFAIPELGGKLGEALRRWFDLSDQLGPIFDLYFAPLYNERMFTSHEFLNLTQALEAYHSRRRGGVYLGESDYEPIRQKLEAVVASEVPDKDFKKSLLTKLKYGNRYALRKRIGDLLKSKEFLLGSLIRDPKGFPSAVADTRNFLVHHDADLAPKARTGADLFWMTRILRWLVQGLFLSELGLTNEEILTLFKKQRLYLGFTRYARTESPL